MMSTRRSLFTGCLVAAFLLFGSPAVFAQTQVPTTVSGIDVDGTDHDEVTVEWVWDRTDGRQP